MTEIHVMPYTHADIAWVHTRAWHVDRYVRVMDEVLALLDANPDYHYYIDTWVELAEPYLRHRPEAADAIRRYIREGRLAICGGQFGNVRSTAVGNETQIRNLQLGLKRWRTVAPELKPCVHSNIDVTFGHSQMPQLLGLAGISMYFVMRPLAALDAQGIPRVFVWEGLSGDRIMVYRDTGVGLFQEHERHGESWDADWQAVRDHLWSTYLGPAANVGTRAIGLTVGVDDSRPERFAFSDAPAHYDALIAEWNRREDAAMRYGTPDTLRAALSDDEAVLQVVEGVLEPTDVHFNIALHGRRGIWWLREQADRVLVDAEIIASLARLVGGSAVAYPEAGFEELWGQLLSWTPHAVQWLFRDDWQEGEVALRHVVSRAGEIKASAAFALADGRLPMDSNAIVLVNPIPSPAHGVTQLWLVNSDLTRGFAGLIGPDGRNVPTQVVDSPVPAAEIALLAEVTAPGCGYAPYGIRWEPAPKGLAYPEAVAHWRARYGLMDRSDVPDCNCTMQSDCLRITVRDGHVVKIESPDADETLVADAPAGASYLEPVCYTIERNGWHTDAVADAPLPFVCERVRIDEAGPLRRRLTREGRAGGFWVRQNLDLIKGELAVRSTLQFLDAADERDALLAIATPIDADADLEVDIPFGIEPRPVQQIRYGISERAIPGLIWGRTWTRASGPSGALALLAEDGDKLFRAFGDPMRLAHIMAQKTRVFEDGWEAYLDTHDVGGRQVFHHVLALGSLAERSSLVKMAERARHPLVAVPTAREPSGDTMSIVDMEPSTVCLSALQWQDNGLVVRIVQMAPEGAEAVLTFPREATDAALIDLHGAPIEGVVRVDGRCVLLTVRGWQIATVRVQFGEDT